MSGSSVDGLDLVCCSFTKNDTWHYRVEAAECCPYPVEVASYLNQAFYKSTDAIKEIDIMYGLFLGEQINQFVQKFGLHPDFIASHGHTIFHRPQEGFTLQIGDGNAMADTTRLTVINDFRSLDVSKGGQGAPLVPVGDRLLFGEYDICLNIGGIANLSFELNGERISFDVCIANQALNFLSGLLDKPFDESGMMARSGNMIPDLYEQLNALDYYVRPFPKSLGREYFEKIILPLLVDKKVGVTDLLRTMVEHIAFQIAMCIQQLPVGKLFITGGGAFNYFLIERLAANSKHRVVVPDRLTINFKEAIVFAFLGVLRFRNETNCLKSVTGAYEDSCTGVIHEPLKVKTTGQ